MLNNVSPIVIIPDLTINHYIQTNCAYSKYQSLRHTETGMQQLTTERTIKVMMSSNDQLIIFSLFSLSLQWKNSYFFVACVQLKHRKYMSFITLSICHSKNETLYSFILITEHTKYIAWDCNFRCKMRFKFLIGIDMGINTAIIKWAVAIFRKS